MPRTGKPRHRLVYSGDIVTQAHRPKLTAETLPLYVEGLESPEGCWLWMRPLTRGGYGTVGNTTAHRFVYIMLGGTIDSGLELDHLCRNRRCVNPAHLEPVTHQVNQLRSPLIGRVGDLVWKRRAARTVCSFGHTNWATRIRQTGRYAGNTYRFCIDCGRRSSLQWYYANKK